MQASGTSRFGFSTASEVCAADSMPRKAQRVSEMLEPIPCAMPRPCGSHAAPKVAGLNQNQPRKDSRQTGTIPPQTEIEPILPVLDAAPKLATVVSQSSAISRLQLAIGAEDAQGLNEDR